MGYDINKCVDGDHVAEFAYDALGRRFMKTDNVASQTTYYYYNDQWQVLAEYNGPTSLKYNYAYGNYIDEVLLRFIGTAAVGPVVKFFAHDHLYSPVALMDTAGNVQERYEYDAYGKVHIMDADYNSRTSSSYGNDYTFTGRQLDILDGGDLNIMYYRNRYYHPELGRFMTQDPVDLKFLQYYTDPMLYSLLIASDTRYKSIKTNADVISIKNDMLLRITLLERYRNSISIFSDGKNPDFGVLGPHFFFYEDLSISLWHGHIGYEANLYQYTKSSPIYLSDPLGLMTYHKADQICRLAVLNPCLNAGGHPKTCAEAAALCWDALIFGGKCISDAIKDGKDTWDPPRKSADSICIAMAILMLGFHMYNNYKRRLSYGKK